MLGTGTFSLVQEKKATSINKLTKKERTWNSNRLIKLLVTTVKQRVRRWLIAHDDIHDQRFQLCVSISWAVLFLFLKCFLSPPVPSMGMHLSDLPWREILRFFLAVTPLGISLTLSLPGLFSTDAWLQLSWFVLNLPFQPDWDSLRASLQFSALPTQSFIVSSLLSQASSLNRFLELLSTYSCYLSFNPSQALCPINVPHI